MKGQGVFPPSLYSSYRAKCTQATTAAPAVGTEHENTIAPGGAPTLARTSIGLYTVTWTGKFTAGKTYCRATASTGASAMRVFNPVYTSADVITLSCFDLGATPAAADSGDFDLYIEVRD